MTESETKNNNISQTITPTNTTINNNTTPENNNNNNINKNSDVMVIDGKYYDTKALASIHPGGELFVLLCNGQDGTTIFNSYHRRRFPHDKYKKYLVPSEQVSDEILSIPQNKQDFTLFFELCEKIKPIIAPTRGFAPWHYYLKVALILSLTFYLDFILPMTMRRPLWASMLLGWLFGLIGLNIQHDANHGAISGKYPIINRLLGLSQDYLGGSSLMWMMNHNTIHHVHSNDTELDHDLAIPCLRLHEKIPWKMPYMLQQVYFIVLEAFFGPVHIFYNISTIWSKSPQREQVFDAYRMTSKCLSLLYPLRFMVLLYNADSLGDALVQLLAMNIVGGLYLAFFFLISHNYHGVRKEDINSLEGCYVRNQAETSSNVGYEVLCQFNGGLNYQIEHHLFPRINHNYYPRIAPVVRRTLLEHGIHYEHFATVWDNFISTYQHLKELGKKSMP